MKLIPVDPEDIQMIRSGRRGRVSYPILKMFLESGQKVSKLDKTGIQQSNMSLNSSLNAYIRNHGLPVEMFTAQGEIYLVRTDVNDDGVVNAENNDIHKIKGANIKVRATNGDHAPYLGDDDDDEADDDFGESEAE